MRANIHTQRIYDHISKMNSTEFLCILIIITVHTFTYLYIAIASDFHANVRRG